MFACEYACVNMGCVWVCLREYVCLYVYVFLRGCMYVRMSVYKCSYMSTYGVWMCLCMWCVGRHVPWYRGCVCMYLRVVYVFMGGWICVFVWVRRVVRWVCMACMFYGVCLYVLVCGSLCG